MPFHCLCTYSKEFIKGEGLGALQAKFTLEILKGDEKKEVPTGR